MERLALTCPACEKAGRPRREFDNPAWRCPQHPGQRPKVQLNHPYFGKAT